MIECFCLSMAFFSPDLRPSLLWSETNAYLPTGPLQVLRPSKWTDWVPKTTKAPASSFWGPWGVCEQGKEKPLTLCWISYVGGRLLSTSELGPGGPSSPANRIIPKGANKEVRPKDRNGAQSPSLVPHVPGEKCHLIVVFGKRKKKERKNFDFFFKSS